MLDCIEIETAAEPQAAVIWLHGLGADARDFAPVVPAVTPATGAPLRFIFPDAPQRPVTINGGIVMRAWYDVLGFEAGSREDLDGIRAMAAELGQLIEGQAAAGIPPARISLAGFSQGAAMALYTALRFPQALAGIVALSSYFPVAAELMAELHPANRQTPVFMGHGDRDPVLPIAVGRQARKQLESLGYAVTWKTYTMMHAVLPEELADVRDFFSQILSAEP